MATKDITKELMDAIEQTLPETQVGLIKEVLQERDELKEEILDMKESILSLEKDLKEERMERVAANKELDKLTVDYGELNSKLVRIQQLNEDFEKKDVERRAEIAEEKLRVVQETQELFLKNTIYRETVQSQTPMTNSYTGSQFINGQFVPTTNTSTTLAPVTTTTDRTATTEGE